MNTTINWGSCGCRSCNSWWCAWIYVDIVFIDDRASHVTNVTVTWGVDGVELTIRTILSDGAAGIDHRHHGGRGALCDLCKRRVWVCEAVRWLNSQRGCDDSRFPNRSNFPLPARRLLSARNRQNRIHAIDRSAKNYNNSSFSRFIDIGSMIWLTFAS